MDVNLSMLIEIPYYLYFAMSCPEIGLHKVNKDERTKDSKRAFASSDF